MKKILVYLISLIILLALNVAFPMIYRNIAPNFLFLLVIFYAFRKDNPDFLWIAFFAGLLLDIFGGNFFGSFTLGFLLISELVNFTTRTFFTADPSIEFMVLIVSGSYLALAGFLFAFNFLAFRLHWVDYQISPRIFAGKIWLDLLLNLVFAAPVYYLTVLNDRILLKGQR